MSSIIEEPMAVDNVEDVTDQINYFRGMSSDKDLVDRTNENDDEITQLTGM